MITNVGLQDRLIRMTIGLFFLIIGLNNGITTLLTLTVELSLPIE